MSPKSLIPVIFSTILLLACQDNWDNYYHRDTGETIDRNVWELISEKPEYSQFVALIKQYQLDSIFTTGRSITVFVPSNSALTGFDPDSGDIRTLLPYHIVERVINVQDITRSRLIETASKKFALIERDGNIFTIDGSEIVYFSPLCRDGRFYEISEVMYPRPTLYDYIALSSSIYKKYIDSFDTVYLDVNLSTPVGFDEQGNTIYDSVFIYENLFDNLFYPVNKDFRSGTATVVLFDEEQYNNALNEMAGKLGENFASNEDIPEEWQFNVLLPRLVRDGIFEGSLQYSDFFAGRLKNIAGDSVDVDISNIDEDSRYVCSNGVVFKYLDYKVPEELYLLERRVQGEHLIRLIGGNVFGWRQGVTVSGSNEAPIRSFSQDADNDSLMTLNLGIRYAGDFNLEFNIPNVFPQRYRLEWRANFRPSGIFEVYVNDELVGQVNLFNLRSGVLSVTGNIFAPSPGGLNRVDFVVDNITEYGNVKIGLKYIDTGGQNANGLTIDYVSLIPFPL
jgi:hypothetical protein